MYLSHVTLIRGIYPHYPKCLYLLMKFHSFLIIRLFSFCRLSKGFAFVKFTSKQNAERVRVLFRVVKPWGYWIYIFYSILFSFSRLFKSSMGKFFGKGPQLLIGLFRRKYTTVVLMPFLLQKMVIKILLFLRTLISLLLPSVPSLY